MNSQIEPVEKKHQWLISHVDVSFPTPESILGRDLYIAREKQVQYIEIIASEIEILDESLIDDVYLVDFHRLTVMFAQLQSSFWSDKSDQNYVLEFFAQIALSQDHNLYVGFKGGQATVCGMTTVSDRTLLISDLISLKNDQTVIQHFVSKLVACQGSSTTFNQLIVSSN
ncbi:hypothetical protein [Vibrio sp. VB16]|uniref:hypothetical protein n=1 Tax=Vibrio sp. VB16 TaxID=2785746 RepID=UPI0018A02C82|nr:hypothetical protein [Vibrio sp. VB16]UGA57157.1 hypothetical protein IUZ65_016760 [Vibrio sp. VB16]